MAFKETDILPGNEGPMDQRFHEQTAMVLWSELERHFARGSVLHVSSQLDLVEVATCLAEDDCARIKNWMEAGKVGVLTDEQASDWATDKPIIWAVVVAPWVLAQENDPAKTYPGKKAK